MSTSLDELVVMEGQPLEECYAGSVPPTRPRYPYSWSADAPPQVWCEVCWRESERTTGPAAISLYRRGGSV